MCGGYETNPAMSVDFYNMFTCIDSLDYFLIIIETLKPIIHMSPKNMTCEVLKVGALTMLMSMVYRLINYMLIFDVLSV